MLIIQEESGRMKEKRELKYLKKGRKWSENRD